MALSIFDLAVIALVVVLAIGLIFFFTSNRQSGADPDPDPDPDPGPVVCSSELGEYPELSPEGEPTCTVYPDYCLDTTCSSCSTDSEGIPHVVVGGRCVPDELSVIGEVVQAETYVSLTLTMNTADLGISKLTLDVDWNLLGLRLDTVIVGSPQAPWSTLDTTIYESASSTSPVSLTDVVVFGPSTAPTQSGCPDTATPSSCYVYPVADHAALQLTLANLGLESYSDQTASVPVCTIYFTLLPGTPPGQILVGGVWVQEIVDFSGAVVTNRLRFPYPHLQPTLVDDTTQPQTQESPRVPLLETGTTAYPVFELVTSA